MDERWDRVGGEDGGEGVWHSGKVRDGGDSIISGLRGACKEYLEEERNGRRVGGDGGFECGGGRKSEECGGGMFLEIRV